MIHLWGFFSSPVFGSVSLYLVSVCTSRLYKEVLHLAEWTGYSKDSDATLIR